MSESILIELRQLNENTKVMNNGDYISTMLENVTLSQNDSIVVKNAFIDTTIISNEFITLTEDYTINSDIMYYNYSFQKSQTQFNPNFATTTANPVPSNSKLNLGCSLNGVINGLIHVLCSKEVAVPLHYSQFINITFNKDPKVAGETWGDIPFDVEYTDIDGKKRTCHSFFYSQLKGTTVNASILGTGGIIALDNNNSVTVVITDENMKKGKILDFSIPNSTVITGYLFHPKYETLTGKIPKGKYTPIELAELINGIFQIVTQTPLNLYETPGGDSISSTKALRKLGNSNFYGQTNEIFVANTNSQVYADYFGTTGGSQIDRNINGSGLNSYITTYSTGVNTGTVSKPIPAPNFWTGASQVEFTYDDSRNKMSINYAHTPQYATASDASINGPEVVTVKANDFQQDKQLNPVNAGRLINFFGKANGGIIFSSLTSSPPGFWNDVMGFDLNSLCESPQYQKLDPVVMINTEEYFLATKSTFFPYMDLIEGKNITAPLIINDMNIQKNGKFYQEGTAGSGLAFEVVGTTAIVAPNVLLDSVLETAYYLIEVDSKFKNNVLTSDKGNMRNVQTICNTYFNSGNYTSASSADSIIYTHQGVDDITLQSFGVRVLDSNKDLAVGIGPDNAVFLEVIRANKPLAPQEILTNNQKKKEKTLYET